MRLNFRFKVTFRSIATLRLLIRCLRLRPNVSGNQISHFVASQDPFTNSIPPTQTYQIINLLVLTTSSDYLLIITMKGDRRFSVDESL